MSGKKTTLKPSDYVHLHNHTQYSLLDGLTKVPALIDRIKDMGMSAVAVTDHGTMSGAIEFYKAARAQGIKPIIGMETYVASRGHTDRDPVRDRQNYHLTLLAMNFAGYQNLMRLASIANLDGMYYKPRVDHDLLEKYSDGLIVLSGCIGGEVGDALRQGQYDQAKKTAQWYKKVFGDRYYIELMDHGHPDHPTAWVEQTKVNDDLLKLAAELNIQAVLTCDAHYLNHEDQEAHEILLCVQTGAFLTDENRFSLKNFELHVADPKEIIKRWGTDHPELILNTQAVANRCEVRISLDEILIPKFPTPKGQSEKSVLETLVWQGLAWRYSKANRAAAGKLSIAQAKSKLSKSVIDRATYELGVVDGMGFNGYYLIVQDFINWGKNSGIVFGPGRGSAASSIMAYALRITEIDPLAYNLLFERFLNPDRISMPDMDIDIQDSRREEVINYCVDKYGRDRVANIVTFGRMAARNSVRDVARVLQVPYAEADRLAKMIPPPVQGRHIPLAESLKESAELKEENKSNPGSARVFDLATKLEGTIRSHGVHAAGVIIAPEDIVKYTPLEIAQKGAQASQYSMGPIEELGLLKMDFLGLSNLTTIKNAMRIVKRVYGKDIDIDSLPLDDAKTFAMLRRGETTGVFQLESAGMVRFIKELKPNQFDDIIAMVALYRPGPIAEFPQFIQGKNNPSSINYPHPSLEPILKDTYGVIVFQEQIIALLQLIAGYTPGEADLVRKAIGKKKRDIMKAEEPRFIEGCIKRGLSKDGAEKLWGLIQPFADYSFNKAHAACYGLIAYQTAYLKANFPIAYMAALLTSDYDNIDRLAIEITECKKMGIKVLPPDVNESFHEFAVVPGSDQIRFGLDAIKNVGHGAAEEILRGRDAAGGQFTTLEDFCKQVNSRIVNRKSIESLVRAGAFDRFGDRSVIYNNIENILSLSARLQKDAISGQVDLFGNSTSATTSALGLVLDLAGPEHSKDVQLAWERELMGLYLSHDPLESYMSVLSDFAYPIIQIKPEHEGKSVTVGGYISDIREITTKNGAKMAFVKLADSAAEIELVLFPKTFAQTDGIWQRDQVVLAQGKVGSGKSANQGSELKVLVDDARALTLEEAQGHANGQKLNIEFSQPKPNPFRKNSSSTGTLAIRSGASVRTSKPQRLFIRLLDSNDQPLLSSLKQKLDGHVGDTEVVLVTGPTTSKQVIKLPQTIDINEQCLRDLAGIFGSTNVIVK